MIVFIKFCFLIVYERAAEKAAEKQEYFRILFRLNTETISFLSRYRHIARIKCYFILFYFSRHSPAIFAEQPLFPIIQRTNKSH